MVNINRLLLLPITGYFLFTAYLFSYEPQLHKRTIELAAKNLPTIYDYSFEKLASHPYVCTSLKSYSLIILLLPST